MSETARIMYAFDGFLFTHGRRLGERRTLCGMYSLGSAEFDDERPRAEGTLCRSCAAILAGADRNDPLNDDDQLAHQHATFHGLDDALAYRLCPWELCNFWEIAGFLKTSPDRPAIQPVDEIREAHGRFHDLPGALIDDEDDPELCDFVPIAQLLMERRSAAESVAESHEIFHDRPAIFADQEACVDPRCTFAEIAAFVATRWARPALSPADRLRDAHGRFHDLPGALLADDCALERCTFWAVASAIAANSL